LDIDVARTASISNEIRPSFLLIIEIVKIMEREKEFFKIWEFKDAPKKYSTLSTNGGDEDWVAFVPESMDDTWKVFNFFEYNNKFGDCEDNTHDVDGGAVYIGSHA